MKKPSLVAHGLTGILCCTTSLVNKKLMDEYSQILVGLLRYFVLKMLVCIVHVVSKYQSTVLLHHVICIVFSADKIARDN